MDNPRPEKVAVVEEVRERLDAASAAILTEYRGLTVKDLSALRRSLTAAGGTYKIYKNTLVGFAVRDLGLDELTSMLTGPTAIAFVDGDAVEVAKALRDFARTHPSLVVKGGLLGRSVLTPAGATALADVPPREVLLARIAGAFAAPMVQFAGLLEALPRNLAYGLKALIDKKGGAPGTPAGDGGEVATATDDGSEPPPSSTTSEPAEGARDPGEPAPAAPSPESPAEGGADTPPADPSTTTEPAQET